MNQTLDQFQGYPALKRAVMISLTESIPLMIFHGGVSLAPEFIAAADSFAKEAGIPFTARSSLRCECGNYQTKHLTCTCHPFGRRKYWRTLVRKTCEYGMFWNDDEVFCTIPEPINALEQILKARALPDPELQRDAIYRPTRDAFVQTYHHVDMHNLILVSSAIARLNGHFRIEIKDYEEALRYQFVCIQLFHGRQYPRHVRHHPEAEREVLIAALVNADLGLRDYVLGKLLRLGFKGYHNMSWVELQAMRRLKV